MGAVDGCCGWVLWRGCDPPPPHPPQALLPGSAETFTAVSCSPGSGSHHCLALSTGGNVYSWGAGEKGKLGHGSTE